MKLKKFKIKNKKQIFVISFSIFIGLILGYFLFGNSYAFYEENKDFNIINGAVEDPGDIYFAYYVDGEISREMPVQNTGYTLDNEKSNCNNGVIPTWDNAGWKFIGDYHNYNATDNTRTKCTLYFNKTAKTVSTVLGNMEVNTYTPDFTKSACDDDSCESHEKGIYETTDYDGNPTYYYRGSVENNYVKFAGFYWRIIRIIGSNDNMYVGYMYTNGEAHGTNTSSTIKINVDKFYTDKLMSYAAKLDTNVGFCGDRSSLNLQPGVGTGMITTYNKGYVRVEESAPTLSCENTNDYYTVVTSENGNKALTYPIGLITTDEVMFAGHAGGIFDGTYNDMKSNNKSYLTTGSWFITMTPAGGYNLYGVDYWNALIFVIASSGNFDDSSVYNTIPFRPVINIRSDVAITGSGTITNPYIIN